MRYTPHSGGGGREKVFLGLGSNVGRRPDHLRRALRFLNEDPAIRIVQTSFLYKTSPVGYTSQRTFLNGVAEIRTPLSPAELLLRLQCTERRMGKSVPFRGGPRRIDIDLLLYGKRIVRTQNLVIPHPRVHRRRFVLVPLAEIAPSVVHPKQKKTVARLLRECTETGTVEQWGSW